MRRQGMQLVNRFFYILIFQFMFFADGEGGFLGGGNEGGATNEDSPPGNDTAAAGNSGTDGGNEGEQDAGGVRLGDNGPVVSLPDGVDDSVRNAVNGPLKNFFDNDGKLNMGNVLKSYVHNQGLLGADKVPVPKEEWGSNEWAEFNSKIGIPKDLNDYKVKNNVPEGLKANDDMFKSLVKTAHENGIRPEAFQKVADAFNESIKLGAEEQKSKADAIFEQEQQKLKDTWGEAYGSNLNQAMAGLKQFADDEQMQAFSDRGYFDDPLLTELFQKVGKGLLQEDDTFDTKARQTARMEPQDALKAIKEHMQKPEARTASKEHGLWVAEYQRLLKIAHGVKQANKVAGAFSGSVV